jgi:hypothetical protein
MIGVRFTRDMRPWQAGATAILPDTLARKIIDEGAGEEYRFPAAPHAALASPQDQVVVAVDKGGRRGGGYRTKGV